MIKKHLAGFGILALAACGTSPAPPPSAPAGSAARAAVAGPIQPPPVFALIGQREKLGLTSAQVTALDSIGVHIDRANAPLMSRLRELRGEYGGRRNAPRPDSEELQPTLEQLRRNNQQAMEGVRNVLTAPQRTTACEMAREADREAMRDRRGQSAQRDRQPRGMRGAMAADSALTWNRPPTWSWCASPAQGQTPRSP